MRFAWLLFAIAATACGRIGYEPRIVDVDGDAAPADGTTDAPKDTTTDGPPPSCPADTTEFTPPLQVVEVGLSCIDTAERGNLTWTNAKATCESMGRRLCRDDEWAAACAELPGLIDMAGDGEWEWVAEQDAGVALKRGFGACGDMSSHEILVDPYDYRCCVNI